MTPDAIACAAALLADTRLSGARFAGFPPDCRPADAAEGYAVQDALHEILRVRGHAPGGWKIGCTTPVMQRFLAIAQPCAGGIPASAMHDAPARVDHAVYRRVGVECEIAVRLGEDLPAAAAPFDRDRVADSVAGCMAAIEIVDDRYTDYTELGAPSLIADDFFAAGCVLGPPVDDWRAVDLAACQATMTIDGAAVGSGVGAHVMGHPLNALAWLAEALAMRGRGLVAGDIVLTGSIVETRWVKPGDRVAVAIEGLGGATVDFA